MAGKMNSVQWKKDDGTIVLKRDNGKEERLILLRRGFWDAYFQELVTVLGEDGVSVIFRNLIEKMGGKPTDDGDKLMFRKWIGEIDEHILPVSKEESAIHEDVLWKGDDREITVFGDTIWILQDLVSIKALKDVKSDVLTENGASAIIRNVCRKGGMSVGTQALKNYKWSDIESMIETQSEMVYRGTFSVAGWCLAESAHQMGPDGNYMLVAKCKNTYESEGVTSKKPVCTMLLSYMEGFYEGIIPKLGDKSVESKEVKCRSMGDDFCALAFKLKDKKGGKLDWSELEDEWKALI